MGTDAVPSFYTVLSKTLMLLSVAYPNISEADSARIRAFRELHDHSYVDVIAPHWTMIFPGSSEGIEQEIIEKRIYEVAAQNKSIDFVCRYALVYDDDSNDDYYIFLVPDEGFSAISLLHDQLYAGFMRDRLRLDIPFLPHIGIATHKDRDHLYVLATEWNQNATEIRGSIDTLTLCSYDGKKVEDLQHYPLKPTEREQDGGGNSAALRASPLSFGKK